MKIGILTFHYARNYGAILQAYGLQEVLKALGHDPCFLDYHNAYLAYQKAPFSVGHFVSNPIKYILRFFNVYYGYKKAVSIFKDFEIKHLSVYGSSLSAEDVRDSRCDVLVVGSDQVWSPLITNGPDPVYWGMIKPREARLIAYAVSSNSVTLLSTSAFAKVSEWLNNFDAISVREDRLKDYVERQTAQKVKVVVDPTILAGRKVYEQLVSRRVIKEPYVLLYHVESSPSLLKIARFVSKNYNAKLVSISPFIVSERIRNRGIVYYQASVCEMLSLIKYAECVVALSFHGTALSVLFEKDFYSVVGKNMARVEALLNKIGLMDRIVCNVEDISFQRIQYEEPRKRLLDLQNDSLQWLKNSL